jgi:hypothetical protein
MNPEYVISQRTKDNAERMNVLVYPSENHKYKVEVYNDYGLFCGYVGHNGEFDYPMLLELVELRKISLNVANRMKDEFYDKHKHKIRKRKTKMEWRLLWE